MTHTHTGHSNSDVRDNITSTVHSTGNRVTLYRTASARNPTVCGRQSVINQCVVHICDIMRKFYCIAIAIVKNYFVMVNPYLDNNIHDLSPYRMSK